MKKPALYLLISCLLSLPTLACAQRLKVPASHSNIVRKGKQLYLEQGEKKIPDISPEPALSLAQLQGNPKGNVNGIYFDFGIEGLSGTLYFGLIPYGDSRHPQPVYFRSTAQILGGRSFINISQQLKGRYDMVGWEEKEEGVIGYRVTNDKGMILYEGRVRFTGNGPFEVACTLIEGPFVDSPSPDGAIISFETSTEVKARVEVNGQSLEDEAASLHHEFRISGLKADQDYEYTVHYDGFSETYGFKTAPQPGSRRTFSFAYASDSRSGQGGGERDVYGANYYIMKKIMALATYKEAAFMQFSGDLIDGYSRSPEEMHVQYANWKRAVEPFAHYLPIYISMGNHEALNRLFYDQETKTAYTIDRFPFETESSEAVFAENFVNPTNGPESEDGAYYDPDEKTTDFPSYRENVFYYTYDNVAVVVMNSDYWYAPSTRHIPITSGGLHGYIMDQQLAWLRKTIATLEADDNIDHIFITQHTPFFPNGGHVGDDMWYRGNNEYRPYVNGQPLEKGIIERRDELLDIIVNQSEKVIAILTGDEHNYCRTEIGPNTEIYPEDYTLEKVSLSRTIWQINNGAAGAPYYAQEETPWTPWTKGFTTQNALVFFHVEGKNLSVEVRNPDTLEEVDRMNLR
jgi:3',5'-cyclic AMP phosphodiesterase CpdA